MFKKLKKRLKNLFKKETKEEKKEVKEKIIEEPTKKEERYQDETLGEKKKGHFVTNKPKEEKKSFGLFKKTIKITKEKISDLNEKMRLILLENNVAYETIEKIESELIKQLEGMEIRKKDLEDTLKETLKNILKEILHEDVSFIELVEKKIKERKPLVIAFFGINGSGKTTTIAKIAYLLKKNKFSCVLAASDTFRAAAIQQLEVHAKKLGIKMIKHDYGSDPAAVAFDAIKHAESKGIDVVLIDTAGRMHSNENLMKEMEKIVRVAKPRLKIFVAESITGNDAINQAKKFDETIGIDGVILAKADVDEKGGTALSISHIIKKPIFFLGVGQKYKDLKIFKKKEILDSVLY